MGLKQNCHNLDIAGTDKACRKDNPEAQVSNISFDIHNDDHFQSYQDIPDTAVAYSSIPAPRLITEPSFTSILKPGAIFSGYQESGRQRYLVQVKLLNVNLNNSELSGLLTIHGLTESYPLITTFFNGEIIGPNYSFITGQDRNNWGSNLRNDIQHWSRFTPFRKLDIDLFKLNNNNISEQTKDTIAHKISSSGHIFMRWKEKYLYPDVEVTDIKGASFAGFYYVCLDEAMRTINGLYYHNRSDKFQQLILSFVNDDGVSSTFEYA